MGLAYLLEPSFQIVDKSGNPLSNGYIEVYIAGTSTKYYCYSDFGGQLHPFRIPLDAIGSNIILASTELIYDVFVYNQFGTMIMSRHRVTPKTTSTPTSGHSYILVEGTEGQITVESSGSTDITYKVGLDDAIINELSGIHTDIQSTSAYFENKIDNLDIHNISIEQSGDGNAYTSFTKNGDVYTFNKEATYLPSANAPVVLAGENVEVSAANANGRTIYTIKANPAGNVTNLISTDETISISATSVGNDVTYDLSVKDIAGDDVATYAFLKSEMPVNTSEQALEYTDIHTNGIHWNTIDQRLEFGDNIKLVDFNYNIEYEIDTANGVTYEDLILYILSDGQVLEQQTFNIDTSIVKHICKFNKKILDPSNLQFMVKVPKAGTIAATIDINDETFKSVGTSVSGSTYYAGLNINISDNVISGRDWSNEINAKLDTTAFVLPNSANWDNTYDTVNSNSAQWSNDTTYSAGPNIDITNNTISSKDWTPELNAKLDTTAFVLPTAGDGIAITNSEISVNAGKGLGFDVDKKLEVKVGDGLAYDAENKVITVDSDVSDVVASVNKLKKDLDTQIITNFDMPNISKAYDFADPSVSTLANGACMLCQSFIIPINHEIRTITDDANAPTLMGIYAQQSFGQKIMLALYEYTYAKEGQSQGSTTYVGDTGPVSVVGGVNEFPLKNRNPSITELRCDKVYYATLYLPNAAHSSGLYLAGCPGYGNQSIPAEPRLTCALENITWNGQEIDMNDPTATLNHYQEVIIPDEPVYYQYHIGPWQSGYNERWSAPRFYMQIRNSEYNVPVVPTEPFVDLDDALPTGSMDMPSFTPSQQNSTFRDVTPSMNVTITAFEWIDCMQTAAQWATGQCVYDSGFANNLSGQSNTVVELGQVGNDGYAHRITFTTPITLTAGSTYRFLCGCSDGTQQFKVWLDPTNIIHAGNNGWYLDNYNTIRIEHQMGMYNKLYNSNNSWVI